MKEYLAIEDVKAIEVLDSRGNPTIQVEVMVEGGFCAKASVPSGASTGSFEAVELRDGDKDRYLGKGVLESTKNINEMIADEIIGMNVYEQGIIDRTLIQLDGTKNKAKLGANGILGVSLAVCKAAAKSLGMPLYAYIGGISGTTMPMPMMNILNGGKHSDNNINIQEFMIVPVGARSFKECLRMGTEVYHNLKQVLKKKGYSTAVGDEGGFAPDLKNEEQAIENILDAIEKAGYEPKKDIAIALDIASTEMYEEAKEQGKEGYYFWKTGELKTQEQMLEYLVKLTEKYPIVSIEDGLAEEDWNSWKALTQKLGDKIQLVGDDLFVTNLERLETGIRNKVGNSILIKPNQIGTLTETIQAVKMAKKASYTSVISHRSGETEDTTIADIAVGLCSGQIKTGAPCRSDRVAKYNRLLTIESELGKEAEFKSPF